MHVACSSIKVHCSLYGIVVTLPVIIPWMHDYLMLIIATKTNAFFLGTSTDVTLQMTALHEQTDWPCATSTVEVRELQPSETQPSETLPVVARKQSNHWNCVEGIQHSM